MKKLMLVVAMAGFVFAANAQTSKQESKKEGVKTEQTTGSEKKKETFQCPMKCEGEKTYDKAGNCPKCKMDLTIRGAEKKEGCSASCKKACGMGKKGGKECNHHEEKGSKGEGKKE